MQYKYNEIRDRVFHDYRSDVIFHFSSKPPRWKDSYWEQLKYAQDVWKRDNNILVKTLIYELTPACTDVESFDHVKDAAFSNYCNNYKNEYEKADIMNGWWPCFKFLFRISSRKEAKERIESIIKELDGKNDKELCEYIMDNTGRDERVSANFLAFLRVVYSVGNMTPCPVNKSTGKNGMDNWEYKLEHYKQLYHDYNGDIERLYFYDYKDDGSLYTREEFLIDPGKYMYERVKYIVRRGYMIINGNRDVPRNDESKLMKELGVMLPVTPSIF